MAFILWLAQLAYAAPSDLKTRLDWLLVSPLTGLPLLHSPSPPTEATAKLGRLLFYDKRLSADGTVSCASCHGLQWAFSNTSPVSTGIGGALGRRKAPPLVNKAFLNAFFWDGRAASLESQAVGPLFNPSEMGSSPAHVMQTLDGLGGYQPLFLAAFGDPVVTVDRVARAVADFERTLLSGDSLWDRWQADPNSVVYTAEQQRGYELFLDRDCAVCHTPPLFTDNQFHNTGIGYASGVFKDLGRFEFTQLQGIEKNADRGAFKTPTLRSLLNHAPYMHDGSLNNLAAVVDFYDQGGTDNPHLSEEIIPLGLQPAEKRALVAFLATLEGAGYQDLPPQDSEMPR